MTKQNLHTDLKEATQKLLEQARELSWNTISNNCLYIISEIQDLDGNNAHEQRRIRKQVNRIKEPRSLQAVVSELEGIYEDLHDVNLYVFHANSKRTVIEIQLYLKSSLQEDHINRENDPMLHCKVAIPPYAEDSNPKFDINWELGGLRHEWKMYWCRKRVKREGEEEKIRMRIKSLKKAVEKESEEHLIRFLRYSRRENIDFSDYHLIEKALSGRWHSQHEDLVHIIDMEILKDDRFIDPILEIALNKEIFRWYDDELESTLRKCVHALKTIDSEKSNVAIQKLKDLNNDNVKYALELYE